MGLSWAFKNINWLAVIVMTAVSFLIGFAWHRAFLFGKTWQKENKYDKDAKINLPLVFGGTAVFNFIALAALSAVTSGMGTGKGLFTGFLFSVVWILPAFGGTYLFANRSLKLLAIDAGMYILLFSLSGLVFGVW